ncbi:MAG TPA: TIGR04283 family arsenosugar biosynthesis glycosyltransferase [Nitrospiraceae bacterium]|nr:TIGR04283 family arsenosugar biosynthesis glycosyltransferase [Nitrospiraceae bacterium]
MTISVIIPTLNEQSTLPSTLEHTFRLGFDEIIVTDGGSTDGTRDIVLRFALSQSRDTITECPVLAVTAPPGRANQMNAGAGLSRNDVLLFLHADTILPDQAKGSIIGALADRSCVGGRFDVQFDRHTTLGRIISTMMNVRSRLSGIATGDQAIFVRREVFEQMRGYRPLPLMEDIDFTRRLKKQGRIAAVRSTVTTSYRRWARQGATRTVVRMWILRLLYWLGVSPRILSRFYTDVR